MHRRMTSYAREKADERAKACFVGIRVLCGQQWESFSTQAYYMASNGSCSVKSHASLAFHLTTLRLSPGLCSACDSADKLRQCTML